LHCGFKDVRAMPNILLTEQCVRTCPYCFAKKHIAGQEAKPPISWDNLLYVADFLQAGGERSVSLLGGEPSLHPHFVDFILFLVERGFHVNVFTSAIMSGGRLDEMAGCLNEIDPERLSFVVNLNQPGFDPPPQRESIDRFLSLFGAHSCIGVNIYKVGLPLDYVFRSILRFGLKRHLRIGLAHPIAGENNVHVPVDRLRETVGGLMEYLPAFERMRVVPGFDCGMPLCLFTDEQLARLFKLTNGSSRFGCGPAIDIGPDMTVWPCFPFSQLGRRSIFDFKDFAELRNHFEKEHDALRIEASGILVQCDTCRHRLAGVCQGGCRAHFAAGAAKAGGAAHA
jgi:radical SAM protein with 4Fe4S-binding SPASM domain